MHNFPKLHTKGRGARGFALVFALMLVVVMLILVGSLLESMPKELQLVAFTGYDNRALYLADGGVQEFITRAEEADAQGKKPNSSYTYTFPGDSSTYTVSYGSGDAQQVGGLQMYRITSIGVSPQGEKRSITAVVGELSFSHYNYWGKTNASGNYFVTGTMQFNGPVYLEGSSSLPVNVEWADSDPSLFLSKDTTIAKDVAWYNGGASAKPSTSADWLSVSAYGQAGVSLTTNTQNFPPDVANTLVAAEAYAGNQTNAPGALSPGVYMNSKSAATGGGTVGSCKLTPCAGGNVSTGIYVSSNTNVSMSASPSNASPSTQTFVFSPPATETGIVDKTTVVVDFTNNKTTVTDNLTGDSTVYKGVPNGSGGPDGTGPNGAIFVNGNIDSLSGTVNGQYTLAVPDTASNGKNVIVTGSILYHTDPRTCACTTSDVLGIYGHNITVADNASLLNTYGDLTIEGALFAGNSKDVGTSNGTFSTSSFNNVCSDPALTKKNDLLIYGSMVQNYISPLGCFDPGSHEIDPVTGQSRYTLVRGWGDKYVYDLRFQTTSPPFYPHVSRYQLYAWHDNGLVP